MESTLLYGDSHSPHNLNLEQFFVVRVSSERALRRPNLNIKKAYEKGERKHSSQEKDYKQPCKDRIE